MATLCQEITAHEKLDKEGCISAQELPLIAFIKNDKFPERKENLLSVLLRTLKFFCVAKNSLH